MSRKTFGKVCPAGLKTDGWLLPSGKEPEIVEVEKWYIDDREIAVKASF
jgi:hypothetical protein